MVELVWKLRVAALWVFLGAAQATGMVLYIYKPGSVQKIIRGAASYGAPGPAQSTTQGQIELALSVLLPLALAFLTLVLSDRANRWASGAVGLLWALTSFFLTLQAFGDVSDFLFTATFFLVSLLVLWHVWKWPLPDRAGPVAHEDRAVQRQAHL